jgi:indolepyruvate decarboxylase
MPINRREFLGASIVAGPAPRFGSYFQADDDALAVNSGEAGSRAANPTVAEYIVQQLAALGIKHVFGVPGDYAFPIDLAVERSNEVTWIGCSNELNAAYAADGYARINGAAALCTTFNVGSAAALAGVMGCKAERVPIFHIVGVPSTGLQRAGLHMHHSYGDGNLEQFAHYHEVSVCASAYLTDYNAIEEVSKVIQAAAQWRMPVYIQIPEDYALAPVIGTPAQGHRFGQLRPIESDSRQLSSALETIRQRIAGANYSIILASFTIQRYGLTKAFEDLLDKTGIYFATTGMSKGIISESHKQFIGMYNGEFSLNVSHIVEGADLVLDIGGVLFCDGETGEFSDHLDPSKVITVWPDRVEIGISGQTYRPVYIEDIIVGLTDDSSKIKELPTHVKPRLKWEMAEKTVLKDVFSQLSELLKPGDILVSDTGVGDLIATLFTLPDGVDFQHALLWGSIGWGTGAGLGVALAADPKRRVVLLQGDGGHQCTAAQIGVMGKYGVNPIIILLNNDIYGIEEVVLGNQKPRHVQEFNKIAQWNYYGIPEAMGCNRWLTRWVDFTEIRHLQKAIESLRQAMQDARDHPETGAYIVIKLDPNILFPALPAEIRERLYRVPPVTTD